MRTPLLATALAALLVAGCGDNSSLPEQAGTGPNPQLPKQSPERLPMVHIAPAKGWAAGQTPTPADGLAVAAFADGLDHPRWLYTLPNGDVLVAETNSPPKPAETGPRVWVMKQVMGIAGAGVPSANRITLLRDADGDGKAELKTAFLTGLSSPFGMALAGGNLYVANSDAIIRFPYTEGTTNIAVAGEKLTDLPGGPRNHHWTKNIIASADGTKLYAAVGSNSNIAENGMAEEEGRAAIWEVDLATGSKRLYATGLRNPVGLAWSGDVLWAAVNERDELGGDLVPDYMTSVRDGGFYGWPWSYYGQTVDPRVQPQQADMVAKAIKPDFALGPHTASLGLTIASNTTLPGFESGAFVGQHGSWNRKPRSGYKVVFAPFTDGKPSGEQRDVLTGFVDAGGNALGRPVGVTFDARGGLLVADDVGNVIWRVTGANRAASLR